MLLFSHQKLLLITVENAIFAHKFIYVIENGYVCQPSDV